VIISSGLYKMLFAILRGLSKELREFMPAIDPNESGNFSSSSPSPSSAFTTNRRTPALCNSASHNSMFIGGMNVHRLTCVEKLVSGALDILKSIVLLCTLEERAETLYASSLFDPVHEFLIFTYNFLTDAVNYNNSTATTTTSSGTVDGDDEDGGVDAYGKPRGLLPTLRASRQHQHAIVFACNLHVAALDTVFAFAECSKLRPLILSSPASSTLENSIEITLSISNILSNGQDDTKTSSDGPGGGGVGGSSSSRTFRDLSTYLMNNFNRFDKQIDKLLNQSTSLSDCVVS
jgi:hypothetical protein